MDDDIFCNHLMSFYVFSFTWLVPTIFLTEQLMYYIWYLNYKGYGVSILEYIKEKDLVWQPSFSGKLENGLAGYRGALIVEEGKQIPPDRKLPPKVQAKQVILVANDEKVKLFSSELESILHFEAFFERYKSFFDSETLIVLYVTDLNKNGTFVYNGVTINAYSLHESSVWNELLELSSLEKGELKKMSNEEKLEVLYDALMDTDCSETEMTFQEILSLKGESSKKIMGAV
jgi:hypothetical protein